ncbi:unnamed protein product [marine sediment metagenome]|uniref:Biopolymer transport protein ExbD/TolR n=1 Tax=marine sediment metagenome TaxID=412755 RepID=X0YHZ1_9ZZZZ
MRIDRKSEEEQTELLNMTPMIDIVFNLLIFFLVGTRYAEIERDMLVNPPSARHARAITATPRELIVNVTVDGRYVIAGVEYKVQDLERIIARAVKENPEQAVVVRGDERAILQLPVNVLNLCEKHAIKRKFLTTITPGGT